MCHSPASAGGSWRPPTSGLVLRASCGCHVTGSWGALLSTLIPLSLVVALSPLSMMPAFLIVLHAACPRRTGLAFLFGWLAGLIGVTVAFVQVPHLLGGANQPAPRWTTWVRIAIGAVLIVIGVWRWASRKRRTQSPRWLNTIGRITPAGALAVGMVLAVVNPKVLLMNGAAGLAIGTAELSTTGAGAAVVSYTAMASSTVAAPMVAYAVAAERVDPQLERVRAWIEVHQAGLTAVIIAAIGGVLLYSECLAGEPNQLAAADDVGLQPFHGVIGRGDRPTMYWRLHEPPRVRWRIRMRRLSRESFGRKAMGVRYAWPKSRCFVIATIDSVQTHRITALWELRPDSLSSLASRSIRRRRGLAHRLPKRTLRGGRSRRWQPSTLAAQLDRRDPTCHGR